MFERGGAIEVPVGRIEAELANLWRRAAEARPGQIPNAVTRACLWNLVVRVDGDAQFEHAKDLIDDLSQRIPARTIVMRIEPDEPDRLRAWVEANWRRREGGGPASGSDEVTLWASGKAVERVPSLVRSLLVFRRADGDVLVRASLPAGGAGGARADAPGRSADRRHAQAARRARPRPSCARSARASRPCSWPICRGSGSRRCAGCVRRCSIRRAIASVLEQLDRVRVVSNIQRHAGARPVGARLARCRASSWRAAQARSSDGKGRARAGGRGARTDKPVTLEVATEPGGDHGVAGLELHAGDDVWSLTRDTSIHVRGPDMPPRSQPARSHSDAELLASALGSRGRDTIFRDALGCAAELVTREPRP